MNTIGKNLSSKIRNIKTLWGVNLDFENLSNLRNQMATIKKSFDGVEIATGFFDEKYKKDFMKILLELDLSVVTQIHTNGYPIKSKDLKVHLDDLKAKLEHSITWNPVLINSHSGTDYWPLEKNIEFFLEANNISEQFLDKSKIELFHETHRQRVLFSPFRSFEIMQKVANIKLTLDLSHWIISSERLLCEESDYYWKDLETYLIKNTGLIHARISTTNNIQVVDPEFYKEYEVYFYYFWKKIIENSSRDIIYVDYEYGPDPYLFINPKDNKPIKDITDLVNEQRFKFEKFLKV